MWRQLISQGMANDATQRQRNPGLTNLKTLLANAMQEKSKQKSFLRELGGKKDLATFEETLPSNVAKTNYYNAQAGKARESVDLKWADAVPKFYRGEISADELRALFPAHSATIDDLPQKKEDWEKDTQPNFSDKPKRSAGDSFPTATGASAANPLRILPGWEHFEEPTANFAETIKSRADLTEIMENKEQYETDNPTVNIDAILKFYKKNGLYYAAPDWFKEKVNEPTRRMLDTIDTKKDVQSLDENIDAYRITRPEIDWDAILKYYQSAGILE